MYERILVPIDGSETSDKGLTEAIAFARLSGGRIRLLNVLDELVFASGYETGATYLKDVLPRLHRRSEGILETGRSRAIAANVPVETLAIECFARRIADVIVEQAAKWPADLIVLGTHGRHGVYRVLLGSDAEQVLRRAPVPVLLVRSEQQVVAKEAATPAVEATV